ncbi:MAG: tRNA (adenosine(37)-N6)-dimethylallyltransferase MiaA [Planctomycetes bacterium]|nr:tRNA (adenosine(37)-N6)-dimethylallyltransferase MiaA [Planctomycetota bacterium]
MPPPPALVLTGPTASGKTAVALLVAERTGAEILAMDSATVYLGMDVGTAKPTPAERARVPHHLLDLAPPSETFSVAAWLRAAHAAEAELTQRGKRALYSGGTPLYLKALLEGLFDAPAQDPDLRRRIEAAGNLHAELAKVDPEAARRLHRNDAKRLVRALEIFHLTGRPISALQEQWGREKRPARIVLLDPPREVLRERIAKRARAMLAGGLVEEAARLEFSAETRKFIGYAEALEVKAGRMTVEAAAAQMAARTWTLVRRQATWFRKLEKPLRIEGGTVEEMAERAAEFLAG